MGDLGLHAEFHCDLVGLAVVAFVKAIEHADDLVGLVAVVASPLADGFAALSEALLDLIGSHWRDSCLDVVCCLFRITWVELLRTFVRNAINIYAQMSLFFDRLKEQRNTLGLSQNALADLCGIALRTQQNYEKGTRSPDAEYLALLHQHGFDVLYLVTGQRGTPAAPVLSNREAALVDNYKHTDEAGKKIIEGTAALAAQSKTLKKA